MDREEMIKAFRENDGNGFETICIETEKNEMRWITFGRYFYNPGADEEDIFGNPLDWRMVDECVTLPLIEFINAVKNHIHLSSLEESDNRSCDEIEDLTEKEAVHIFTTILDDLPYIEATEITMETPDGEYLSKLF